MSAPIPNAEAIALLEKLWPVYYHDIAGSEDIKIAAWDCPVYDNARLLVKSLFRLAYPMIPADYSYEQCVESGELLSEETLTKAWVDYNANASL